MGPVPRAAARRARPGPEYVAFPTGSGPGGATPGPLPEEVMDMVSHSIQLVLLLLQLIG